MTLDRRLSFLTLSFAISAIVIPIQGPSRASELIENYFLDDARMIEHMKLFAEESDGLITKDDLKEFREGMCISWDNYRSYPSAKGIRAYCKKLLAGDSPKSTDFSSAKARPNQQDSHTDCLNARDYEGCMRYKSSNPKEKEDNCKPGKWCIASSGSDILGRPKIEGWLMKATPENQSVGYRRVKPRKVLVRGETNRYLAIERIIRYYQSPRAGTAPTTTTIGTSTTNCSSGLYSINCTTTPALTMTTPGISARLGGVIQFSSTDIIDCEERTIGQHRNNSLTGKWAKLSDSSPHFSKLADKYCPIIESLELSSFRKYAE